MNSEEFKNLYSLQSPDELITPFKNKVGFSLIRRYPEDTVYSKDGMRIFIKVALINQDFFFRVDMTKPENGEYMIVVGEKYSRKVTNFFSDGTEFIFNNATQKVIHQATGKIFTLNEFIEILVINHLSDRLFLKRISNELANKMLKFLFWLSDTHYERIQVLIDKYHYDKGENLPPENDKKNIEPFFKYFYISKNILFTILLITFPLAVFLKHFWIYRDFSLSNPSLILLFFLTLFLCEKFSIWLDRKIREFLMPSKDHFTKKKTNFIEGLHNYQHRNKFKLKLK